MKGNGANCESRSLFIIHFSSLSLFLSVEFSSQLKDACVWELILTHSIFLNVKSGIEKYQFISPVIWIDNPLVQELWGGSHIGSWPAEIEKHGSYSQRKIKRRKESARRAIEPKSPVELCPLSWSQLQPNSASDTSSVKYPCFHLFNQHHCSDTHIVNNLSQVCGFLLFLSTGP